MINQEPYNKVDNTMWSNHMYPYMFNYLKIQNIQIYANPYLPHVSKIHINGQHLKKPFYITGPTYNMDPHAWLI